jgi:transposase
MNRLHVRLPTATERTELDRWTRAGKTAWYQRARTILLAADSGACGTELAQVLGLHPTTTRRWLHAFSTGGLTALAPKPRGEVVAKLPAPAAAGLIALLHEPPPAHGAEAERWTLRDVAVVLVRERYVRQISLESIRRLLQSRKHSWQRAKEWLRSPDPQYAFKKSGAIAS